MTVLIICFVLGVCFGALSISNKPAQKISINPVQISTEFKKVDFEAEINFHESLVRYNCETEKLRIKREAFYKENPDFPDKTLFIQVCNPPHRGMVRVPL